MKSGAAFAGYGGVELAVHEVLGAEPVWFCEFDPAPSKVLAAHWPGVPNHGDVTKVDWSQVEPVDILTGGFPCQDVSHAGKRAGLKDGTRSGLWARMCDAIAILRPRLVLAENVRGLLTAEGEGPTDEILRLEVARDHLARSLRLVEFRLARDLREGKTTHVAYYRRDAVRLTRLHKRAVGAVRRERAGLVRAIATVLRDLADIGYDAAWVGLRAADVGAPHGRFRVFILAWPRAGAAPDPGGKALGLGPGLRASESGGIGRRRPDDVGVPTHDEPTALTLLPTPTTEPTTGNGHARDLGGEARMLPTPTTRDGKGRNQRDDDSCLTGALLPTPRATDGTKGGPNQRGSSGDLMLPSAVQLMPTPTVTNANGNGENGRGEALLPGVVVDLLPTPTAMDSKASGGAVGSSDVTLTDATVRTAQRGIDFGAYAGAIARWEPIIGRPAPSPTESTGKAGAQRLSPAFVEWMMGLPAGWVTGVEITRNEQLKALGNGVVPQQCAAALRHLLGIRAAALEGRWAA